MNFHVRQKVVCIDDKSNNGLPSLLKEGVVYTINKINSCPRCGNYGICVGIRKDEAGVPWCSDCRYEFSTPCIFRSYNPNRFIPIEDYEAMNELVKELTEPKLQEA